MNGVIAWFARNPVAANLLMITIVVAGLLTIPRIRQEVFPEIEVEVVIVTVPYPGAAPSEVEEGVNVRVEEQIQGVDGIDRVRSTASEGVGVIVAELDDDADIRTVLDDIKSRVDAIDSFPEEVEEPVVEQVVTRQAVVNVAVWGDADERTLKVLGQKVRDDLAALPGITLAELAADRPYEISIEVSEQTLRRHGLTFDEVATAVRRSSLDLPGGSVKTRGGEILLRTNAQAYRGPEFERLVLLSRADGTRLLLGDVAAVVDGFEDVDISARFDGKPAVLVQVYRVGNQNALDVADAVQGYVERARAGLPAGMELTVWNDTSQLLRARRATLVRAGRSGFALVILVLALFLRLRLALWVAVGVPVSFLGAFLLMPAFDLSINMLSLFAFILVLGILVDDAIVTGENVHTHQQRDPDRLGAAIRGTQEVSVPVTFGVLTTVAAFVPMLYLPGAFGKLSRTIPLIVIACLIFSLIESKLVLPSHLGHGTGDGRGERAGTPIGRAWVRFQSRVSEGLERFLHEGYRPSLQRSLSWRYTTVAIGAATLMLTLAAVAGGHLRFTFMPQVEADNVAAYVTMPQGTPADVTAEVVELLRREGEAVRREILEEHGVDVVRHVMATVGQQPYRTQQERTPTNLVAQRRSGGHLGEVNIELLGSRERPVKARAIADRWRERVGAVPDAVELVFTSTLFSTGEPINVQLRGSDIERLRDAAGALKRALGNYPGLYDVADSFREGKQELSLRIRPEAEALGLSQQDLARQVRQAFYGEEAQRIQRDRDDVRVMVRYPADERRSLADVENMRIRLPDGTAVPFASVAEATLGRGYAEIRRADRQRIITVTAEVDATRANANEVLADVSAEVLPRLVADYGVSYSLEGERKEQDETLALMGRGWLMALIAIFALLAVPLGSYVQPLIIMSAIPFGLVGAVWGHLCLGFDLSMMSVVGCVALSGVVVNDSLVLVSWINRARDKGAPLGRAVREAGVARFRAILLTSLTTFAGLTPIMLERDVQARFMIPMAISLAFGVLFATIITLFLVPCAYLILEDLRQLPGRVRGRGSRPSLSGAGRPA